MPKHGLIDLGNPVADHPLNRGLVGWWLPLPNNSGGSNLHDITSKRNVAAFTNAPGWATAPNNSRSLLYNGTTNYLTCSKTLLSSETKMSFVASILPAAGSSGSTRTIIGWGTNGGPQFRVNTTDVLGFVKQDIASIGAGTGTVTLGAWNHVVGTYDSSSGAYQFWINGVDAGGGTNSQALVAGAPIFGRHGTSGVEFFSGRIGDVRIIAGRVMTRSEVFANYREWRAGYPNLLRRWSRKSFAAIAGGGATFKSAWARNANTVLGLGQT
ncbi:MAG TPA: LamG-like jellyroll fold domain-containing protein [Planctomycetia bacterium]|nr:LamG-like jellyroll fold domain-containing protein [Planctomycetia bacterium]